MVNGRFQCLGSTQHLKAKFGEGYSLIVKLRVSRVTDEASAASLEAKSQALTDHIKSTFPGTELKELHHGLINYHIVRTPELHWAQLFGAVELARSTYDIEDYSLTQTTLEQIFIRFARMQREPQEIESSLCIRSCCRCC